MRIHLLGDVATSLRVHQPSRLVLQALYLLVVLSLPALAENKQGVQNLPSASSSPPGKDSAPVVHFEADPTRARLSLLSWDTEGGGQAQKNLLRTGSAAGLRVRLDGQWRGGEEFPTQVERISEAETRYRLALAPETVLEWRLRPAAGALKMTQIGRASCRERV